MLELVNELFNVLELPINGRKTDIGHGVKVSKVHHDKISNVLALNFFIRDVQNGLFNIIDDPLNLDGGNGALFTGLFNTVLDLVLLVSFTTTISLNNHRQGKFDRFKSSEALLATFTLTTTADNTAFLEVSGIKNFSIWGRTVRTFHNAILYYI